MIKDNNSGIISLQKGNKISNNMLFLYCTPLMRWLHLFRLDFDRDFKDYYCCLEEPVDIATISKELKSFFCEYGTNGKVLAGDGFLPFCFKPEHGMPKMSKRGRQDIAGMVLVYYHLTYSP